MQLHSRPSLGHKRVTDMFNLCNLLVLGAAAIIPARMPKPADRPAVRLDFHVRQRGANLDHASCCGQIQLSRPVLNLSCDAYPAFMPFEFSSICFPPPFLRYGLQDHHYNPFCCTNFAIKFGYLCKNKLDLPGRVVDEFYVW